MTKETAVDKTTADITTKLTDVPISTIIEEATAKTGTGAHSTGTEKDVETTTQTAAVTQETGEDKTTLDIVTPTITDALLSTITDETTDETGTQSTSTEKVVTKTTEAANVTDSAPFTGNYVFFLFMSLLICI